MTTSEKTITPLRQRMLEDMRIRKLSDKTQTAYVRAVKRLTRFLGRSPDSATIEDLRRFQLFLVDQGTKLSQIDRATRAELSATTSINAAVADTAKHPIQLRLPMC